MDLITTMDGIILKRAAISTVAVEKEFPLFEFILDRGSCVISFTEGVLHLSGEVLLGNI